jgi:hypothetical protein
MTTRRSRENVAATWRDAMDPVERAMSECSFGSLCMASSVALLICAGLFALLI